MLPSHVSCLYFLIGLMASLSVLGCGFDQMIPPPTDARGGAEGLIQIPLKAGRELVCTQGVGGSYSHNYTSTHYDIDLATDPNIREELYAPVSGIAFVHDDPSDGFGRHINIDLGDGTYVVVGHLDEIFLIDGQEVSTGTLMGYEGRSGNATGDHIHIGLHRGVAQQKAGQGTSIPTSYWAGNASVSGSPTMIASKDFVVGRFYESDLSVPLWHPNGTLVKTPDNARVYLIQDTNLRWIPEETVFWSLNYDFGEVTLVSREELSCYGIGEDFTNTGFVGAVQDSTQRLWLLVGTSDNPARYRMQVRSIGWESVMTSWGLTYTQSHQPETVSETNGYLLDWPVHTGYAGLRDGTIVTQATSSDVYVISDKVALPVKNWDVYLLMGFFHRTILTVEDGLVAQLHTRGTCASDVMCLDETAVVTCGGGLEVVDGVPGTGGDPNPDAPLPEPTPIDHANDDDDSADQPADEDEDPTPDNQTEDPTPDEDPTPEEEEPTPAPEEEGSDLQTLTVTAVYPIIYSSLTLTVQPVFQVPTIGAYWVSPAVDFNTQDVTWSQTGDFSGLLGVRLNVNVDENGDYNADDWYCYGHYSTAELDVMTLVSVTLDADAWDEGNLVTWSPGLSYEVNLGCSALLWFGNLADVTLGYIQ